MELKKQYIHRNNEKGRASSQLTLDDDYNVPDMRPDVRAIIMERGVVETDEVKVTPGHIWIRGKLKFFVLYQPDQEQAGPKSLSGEIPFQENISMDQIAEGEQVRLKWTLEDLTVNLINSRKLSIRALLSVEAVVDEIRETMLIYDVQIEEERNLQVLKQKCETLQLLSAKHDNCRFKSPIQLPSNKPNIRELLWQSIQPRGMDTALKNGRIEISGEMLVYVLYEGEGEDAPLDWMEVTVPVAGSIDCGEANENMIFDMKLTPKESSLEIATDLDGEPRTLQMDVIMDLDMKLYEESTVSYLEDLYGLNCRIVPEYQTVELPRLLVKNHSKTRADERIRLQSGQGDILQICSAEGWVELENVQQVEDGIDVTGIVNLKLCYIQSDDGRPVGVLRGVIPFHQKMEVPGIHSQCEYELESGLEQLTTILLDSSQVEVKAVINLNLIVFETQRVRTVSQALCEEEDLKEIQNLPGIVGYIASEGERLWDIAKENHTTVDKLQEMNELGGKNLKAGEKLLIIKAV